MKETPPVMITPPSLSQTDETSEKHILAVRYLEKAQGIDRLKSIGENVTKNVDKNLIKAVIKDTLNYEEAMNVRIATTLIHDTKLTEIVSETAKFYVDTFELQELRELVGFLDSPAGEKYLGSISKASENLQAMEEKWTEMIEGPLDKAMHAKGHKKTSDSPLDRLFSALAQTSCNHKDCAVCGPKQASETETKKD